MDPGGAERILVELALGMDARGHHVGIAAAPGRRDLEITAKSIDRLVTRDAGRSLGGALPTLYELTSAMRDFKPDVVHAQNVKAAGFAGLARRAIRPTNPPPLLATFQGVATSEYRMSARIFRLADEIACVSNETQDGLIEQGYPRQRASVIPNAVPLPEPLCQAEVAAYRAEFGNSEFVVAIVGRLVPQKAHDRFLEAIAQLPPQLRQRTRFLVVGDGPRRGELITRARDLELNACVTFTGIRDDARDIIAFSDLIVFSSDWEGLSVVALEALAARTPVVSTSAQGMDELLSHGGGVVVERNSTALSTAIGHLLDSPTERDQRAQAGRATVEGRYGSSRMLDDYEDLYVRMSARRR